MDILSRKKVQVMTPEKTNILLFGGGNFVRAFIGSIFQTYNEVLDQNLGITVVKVTPGKYIDWIAQDGLYHVNTKGIKNGVLVEETQLISCVREVLSCYDQWREFLNTAGNPDIEYIISNTTESGLRYKEEVFSEQRVPDEFPSKLTIWLYERFKILGNNSSSGVTLIPCELLEDNGTLLKNLILQYAELWTIDPAFKNWLNSACHFCNTLVDRIVPGASQTSK
ncbi:MAG TPA: tagaturonate reductase, partial [Saprospiraceae bacterium]|nr:tagaturonate reductase [Saprospiraceae bacterium]